jgi:hypothetical protein
MNAHTRVRVAGLGLSLAFAAAAEASISFEATGLGGQGNTTANVQFGFTATSATTAILSVAIENTTVGPGRIVGFAFNVPTVDGVTFTSIGGATLGGSPVALSPSGATVIPEVSGTQHESGWFAKWDPDGIKTPGQAGDFDFGVRNNGEGNAFITGATGNGPSIMNKNETQNMTEFQFAVTGTGFDTLTSAELENLFGSELTEAGFAFALRFRNGGSELAVAGGSGGGNGNGQIPLPGAALLAAVGLGAVGAVRRWM